MGLRRDLVRAALTPCEAPPVWIRALFGLVGGLVIVWRSWDDSDLGDPPQQWFVPVIVAVAVAVALVLPATQRVLPLPGLLPAFLGGSAVVVYLCVPETNTQMPTVFALVLVLVLMELIGRTRVPLLLHVFLSLVVLWSGVFGATARPSALVGTLVAMWPPVLVGVAALVRPRFERTALAARLTIAAVGIVAAVVVARTGALDPELAPALADAAVAVGATALIGGLVVLVVRPRRRTVR
jgi:hypothetical protein